MHILFEVMVREWEEFTCIQVWVDSNAQERIGFRGGKIVHLFYEDYNKISLSDK